MVLLDFAYLLATQRGWDKSKVEDGSLLRLNSKFNIRRYVMPKEQASIDYISGELSRICKESLGCLLEYPVMKGQDYDNKIVALAYPKDDIEGKKACAFNVAFVWEWNGQPCIHYGLFIVAPGYQGKGIQASLGFTNLFLYCLEKRFDLWFTDLGRSPSGARNFVSFHCRVCPLPPTSNDEGATVPHLMLEPQASIARAFYDQFQTPCGISPQSTLANGFVVKGSNGKGGATSLVSVQKSTRSRNQKFNNWIDTLCPDPTDELILVGRFSLVEYILRMLRGLLAGIAVFFLPISRK